MARIHYNGTEPGAPPADTYWAPGEERDIDDAAWAERLLRNPVFTEVKQTKAPPKPGAVPETEQAAQTTEPEPEPTTETEQAAPALEAAPAEGS